MEKSGAYSTDQKQRAWLVAEGQELLCLPQRELPVFIELGRQLGPHGIAGNQPQKQREGADAGETEQGPHDRLQKTAEGFRRPQPPENAGHRQKGKKRRKYGREPKGQAVGGGAQ